MNNQNYIPVKSMNKVLRNIYKLNWKLSINKNASSLEGNSGNFPAQTNDFVRYARMPEIIHILEIGFNAGHSAVTFLSASKKVNVVSFDLSIHKYLKIGKKFIDRKFPNRHKLIIGNSLETIPQFYKDNPNFKFDLLFIDGNHEYDFAIGDLLNCKLLAHKNSLVILDDTTYVKHGQKMTRWTEGPTLAFKKMVEDGEIEQISIRVYNKIAGISVGKYIKLAVTKNV